MNGKDRAILLIDMATAICAAKGGKGCFGICDGCLGEATAARAEDMAAVGESLMEAIADNQEHTLLKGWAPINDPAEIVADLLNAYDEQSAELAGAMRAIEPFAKACTISNHEDDDVIDDTLAAGKISFGDMRAARSFFFKTKGTTAVSDDVVRTELAARADGAFDLVKVLAAHQTTAELLESPIKPPISLKDRLNEMGERLAQRDSEIMRAREFLKRYEDSPA